MSKSVNDTSVIEEGATMNDTRDTVGLDLSNVMGACEDTRQTRMSEKEEVLESSREGNQDQLFEFDHNEYESEESDSEKPPLVLKPH